MRTNSRAKLAAAAAACAAVPIVAPTVASAWTASNYLYIDWGDGDLVGNYDLTTKSQPTNSTPGNADWTVDYLFSNNAEVDKVKNKLAGFNSDAGLMVIEQKDGASLAWDEDRGKKNPTGSCANGDGPSDIHMRVYADPNDDRMYSLDWGYYVVGSTHKDLHEGCSNQSFGYSEDAEMYFASRFPGWPVYQDELGLGNQKDYTEGGNHIWKNDGWATRVVAY